MVNAQGETSQGDQPNRNPNITYRKNNLHVIISEKYLETVFFAICGS